MVLARTAASIASGEVPPRRPSTPESISSLTVSFGNISGPLALILLIGVLAHYVPKKWYDFSLSLYTRAPFYAQAFALMLLVLGLQNIEQTGEAPFIYTKF